MYLSRCKSHCSLLTLVWTLIYILNSASHIHVCGSCCLGIIVQFKYHEIKIISSASTYERVTCLDKTGSNHDRCLYLHNTNSVNWSHIGHNYNCNQRNQQSTIYCIHKRNMLD